MKRPENGEETKATIFVEPTVFFGTVAFVMANTGVFWVFSHGK